MIHPEGRPFVLFPLLASGLSALIKRPKLACSFLGLSLANAFFFRNPKREPSLNLSLLSLLQMGRLFVVRLRKDLTGLMGLSIGLEYLCVSGMYI